jgi:hypothetical protein
VTVQRTPWRQVPTRQGIRILFPSGMLGSGLSAESVKRGVLLGAEAIAIDGGSTDSGPYYLGAAVAKTARRAVADDLRILLVASLKAGIPLLVGSCGTNGTDRGVDWVAEMVEEIAGEERLSFVLGCIYSEQSATDLITALNEGRIVDLEPPTRLTAAILSSCEHIVGVMGHEPIAAALGSGANVVLAGRATDTAMVAAVALRHGLPPGPTWHAAKTVECGAQCTTDPLSGPVLVEIDRSGFTVESVDPDTACTPISVAAHMLYENRDPFQMREPSGTLITTDASYTALDKRRVRVEGSRFKPASPTTIKLEGSAISGYETISMVGIRDPSILRSIDTWAGGLEEVLQNSVQRPLGLDSDDYMLDLRIFGSDGILGQLEPASDPPREVSVLLKIRAPDPETANAIAKIANPLLLHMPLPGMTHLPSFAFPFSPAEIERGPSYEFVLNHSVIVGSESELFRTVLSEVRHE